MLGALVVGMLCFVIPRFLLEVSSSKGWKNLEQYFAHSETGGQFYDCGPGEHTSLLTSAGHNKVYTQRQNSAEDSLLEERGDAYQSLSGFDDFTATPNEWLFLGGSEQSGGRTKPGKGRKTRRSAGNKISPGFGKDESSSGEEAGLGSFGPTAVVSADVDKIVTIDSEEEEWAALERRPSAQRHKTTTSKRE